MNSSRIDEVDYAILTCIADSDAIWKKRVHDLVLQRATELPHMESTAG
jgi:hypothetical protein